MSWYGAEAAAEVVRPADNNQTMGMVAGDNKVTHVASYQPARLAGDKQLAK